MDSHSHDAPARQIRRYIHYDGDVAFESEGFDEGIGGCGFGCAVMLFVEGREVDEAVGVRWERR